MLLLRPLSGLVWIVSAEQWGLQGHPHVLGSLRVTPDPQDPPLCVHLLSCSIPVSIHPLSQCFLPKSPFYPIANVLGWAGGLWTPSFQGKGGISPNSAQSIGKNMKYSDSRCHQVAEEDPGLTDGPMDLL